MFSSIWQPSTVCDTSIKSVILPDGSESRRQTSKRTYSSDPGSPKFWNFITFVVIKSIITTNPSWGAGTLQVCYLEEKSELDEGPFLREERNLIDAIAERIAKFIEREWAEDEIRKHRNRDESR